MQSLATPFSRTAGEGWFGRWPNRGEGLTHNTKQLTALVVYTPRPGLVGSGGAVCDVDLWVLVHIGEVDGLQVCGGEEDLAIGFGEEVEEVRGVTGV